MWPYSSIVKFALTKMNIISPSLLLLLLHVVQVPASPPNKCWAGTCWGRVAWNVKTSLAGIVNQQWEDTLLNPPIGPVKTEAKMIKKLNSEVGEAHSRICPLLCEIIWSKLLVTHIGQFLLKLLMRLMGKLPTLPLWFKSSSTSFLPQVLQQQSWIMLAPKR